MNHQPDPYAPPRVDPVPPSPAVRDGGKLWRVEGNRLEVRSMASLPDVCVYGYPEADSGRRVSLVLRAPPPWINQILLLAALAALLFGKLDGAGIVVTFMLAITFPSLIGKKVRLMVFRSQRATRRLMLPLLVLPVLIGVALYISSNYEIRWKWALLELDGRIGMGGIALLGVILLNLIPTKGPSRAVALKDGWFEVKGIAPEAVQRLAEIQQRADAKRRPA